MRRFPVTLLAILDLYGLFQPAPAHADVLVGFARFSLTRAEFKGELGGEFASRPVAWQFAGGVRHGALALAASVDFGPVTAWDETRHGYSPFSVGLGADVRYYLGGVRSGLSPYVRAGLGRMWISGGGSVTRYCAESSTCTAGFFQAQPSYAGWTTTVAVGLEYVILRSGIMAGFWLDAGYQKFHGMEVVERHPPGGLLGLTLGASFGGGRTR